MKALSKGRLAATCALSVGVLVPIPTFCVASPPIRGATWSRVRFGFRGTSFNAKLSKISPWQASLGWLCFTCKRVAPHACIGPVRAVLGRWGEGAGPLSAGTEHSEHSSGQQKAPKQVKDGYLSGNQARNPENDTDLCPKNIRTQARLRLLNIQEKSLFGLLDV